MRPRQPAIPDASGQRLEKELGPAQGESGEVELGGALPAVGDHAPDPRGVVPQPGERGERLCAVGHLDVVELALLGPHVAALGLRFYTGSMFPAAYRHQVFIAEHGSWNRSKEAGRTGYRVTLVRLKQGKAVSYEPFIEGFLDGEEVLGRPVDLLVAADGALLVSDDTAGAIYRISYRKTE